MYFNSSPEGAGAGAADTPTSDAFSSVGTKGGFLEARRLVRKRQAPQEGGCRPRGARERHQVKGTENSIHRRSEAGNRVGKGVTPRSPARA